MRKLSITLVSTLSAVILSQASSAMANGFGFGGSGDVIAQNSIVSNIVQSSFTDRHDTDVVYISECQGDDKLTASAVRFQIFDQPARVDDVIVTYGNGERQRLDIRSNFEPGESSRWIFLNGGVRCIKEVKLVGEATGRRGKNAGTRLQAMLNYDDNAWNPRGTTMGIAFTVLSPQGMSANLAVGTCGKMNERVSALKIIVGVQSAQIDQVQVTYGNGQVDELPVRGRYQRGEHSQWVDVIGRDRCIKSIRVTGRTTSGSGSYTRVLVAARLQGR